jgi:hypothetical protein
MTAGVRPLGPTEEDVTGSLNQALTAYDAQTVVPERGTTHVRFEHGSVRLFDLEEEGVTLGVVRSFEKPDPASSADTAHTNNLAGDVDESKAVEELASILGERRAIAIDHPEHVFHVELGTFESYEQRWILNEPPTTGVLFGQPRERTKMRASPRLFYVVSDETTV